MKYFKKIIGERIYLSPINIEDAEKFSEWSNDLNISKTLHMTYKVQSIQSSREFAEKMGRNDGSNYVMSIILKSNDTIIGNCGLHSVDQINRTADLGILIGEINYHGQGYGGEALSLLLDFGFNILNLHNIMLTVYAYNKSGIKCYQKVGFKEIGRRREARIIGGKSYDEVYMDLLSSEFESPFVKKIMEQGDVKHV